MDRYWLLTNTCYGNWLPGDVRGFVGHVSEHRPGDDGDDHRILHAAMGTEYDAAMPGLEAAARSRMRGPPIRLELAHAEVLLIQFQETAHIRGWSIEAAAILWNHFHLVVGVHGDPHPGKILGDFKAWGTRTLNTHFGKPVSERWWTENGSKRKLPDDASLTRASAYVLFKQPNPLLTWSPTLGLNPKLPI